MVELNQQIDSSSKFPRRKALFGAATAVGVAAGILKKRSAEAGGVRPLKKEGVQIIDREIPGISVEASYTPVVNLQDANAALQLHICIEDQGVLYTATRQLNEIAGTLPGYLDKSADKFDNSCVDLNAVTDPARGEIDETLIGINESQAKHVYRFTRDNQGVLSGEYRGEEIVDFSKINLRDDKSNATPQPQ